MVGPDGPVPFLDLFQGRDELVAHKHIWYDGAPHQRQCDMTPYGRGGARPVPRWTRPGATPVETLGRNGHHHRRAFARRGHRSQNDRFSRSMYASKAGPPTLRGSSLIIRVVSWRASGLIHV